MSVVTQAMIERYATLRRLEIAEGSELGKSNIEGIRANLESWERGEGNPDARLTDSPETRAVFAPLREAYFAAHGVKTEDMAFSNVSFFEPDALIMTTNGPRTVDQLAQEAREAGAAEEAKND